jgi:hypothetical protein
MPTITTRGAGSARGFGLFGRRPTTVVFPGGTTTWTAPNGVNKLTSLVGKGGDGGPAGTQTLSAYYAIATVVSAGGFGLPYITPIANPFGQTQIDYALAKQASINSGSGLMTITDDLTVVFSSIGDGGYTVSNSSPSTISNVIAGSATFAQRNWYNGNMLLTPNTYTMQTSCQVYTPPYSGANTTAFSITFPGGNEIPATTFTYNDVSVTPGTTYTIVNNGSLTATYFS